MNAMILLVVWLVSALAWGGSEQPATTPAPAPVIQDKPNPDLKLVTEIPIVQAPEPKKPFTGEIKTADDLLRALETADADLKTLQSGIIYSKVWMDGSDRHVRVGRIAFSDERGPAGGARKFAVLFEKLNIGDRLTEEPKEYVFDGRTLIERLADQKKVNVLLRLKPGQTADPLRIGEGPVPIPVGQDRGDILARYEASLLPATQDLEGEDDEETRGLHKFVDGAMQLRLVPKQANDKYKDVRLWYRRGTKENGDPQLLPRMARAVLRNGDVDLVRLFDVKTNTRVEAKVFETTAPDGWQVQDVPER
jgi:hypothetical protein